MTTDRYTCPGCGSENIGTIHDNFYDLSAAIRDACEAALDGDAPEQATVTDFGGGP